MVFKLKQLAKAALLLAVTGAAFASSHREAPGITNTPKVDGTDFYMFNSYEAGRTGMVTLIANYLPLQDPYGGPNYFSLDPNALYEIHVDNNGNGQEDITFQFRFNNTLSNNGAGITLPIGTGTNGRTVAIPLRQAGVIANATSATSNISESFTLTVVRGDRRSGTRSVVTNAAGGSSTFAKPIDYIGEKTFGGPGQYGTYADQFIHNINIPGCSAPGRVFVGQRKEAFSVNLGIIFDLINAPGAVITSENNASALNGATAAGLGPFGELSDKNVTSLAIEVPASCLTQGNERVIGAWTTASLRQARLVNGAPPRGADVSQRVGGAWTQVSRLGHALVNEVVIGLPDKDRFNASKPMNDGAFADYVTNPTLPALIQTLFPTAIAPTNFPRTDLLTAFLTGVPGLNRPSNITGVGAGGPPAEMLRLNTSTPAVAAAAQNPLGVIGGDNAGYPNGRRLGDDVVDISLRVVMGRLCTIAGVNTAVGCRASDAPAGAVDFVDGVRAPTTDFRNTFPYLNTPVPGARNATTGQ